MKICNFCHTEFPDDEGFCPKCGKRYSGPEGAPGEGTRIPEQPDQAAPPIQPTEAAEGADQGPAEPVRTGQEPAAQEAASGEEQPMHAASLEDGPTAEIKSGIQATPGRIALAVAAVVAVLGVVVALVLAGARGGQTQDDALQAQETTQATAPATTAATVPATVPADGNPDDVTCKGTYTVTDDEAVAGADTVVATMGDIALTNSQLQVYYWMEVQSFLSNYGSYAAYFGLDYTQPLDTQLSMEGDGTTWQQFFLQAALTNWRQIQAMQLEAADAGLEMDPEDQTYLDGLQAALEETAANNSMTLEELLLVNIGPGADFDDYAAYEGTYLRGVPYYTHFTENLSATQQELEDFFADHESQYADNGITKDSRFVDVRHILIGPEGGTTDDSGVTTYSDAEWEACREKAQAVLDEWLSGEQTEEAFAQLANSQSQDGGSNTNGGLYENVYPGQMVTAFNDWCFDEARHSGDYGLVQTDFGYHVMYFVDSRPQWEYYARSDWETEQINQMLTELEERHPVEIDYSKIALGNVSFT